MVVLVSLVSPRLTFIIKINLPAVVIYLVTVIVRLI